jgi:uncharacterized membrane protein
MTIGIEADQPARRQGSRPSLLGLLSGGFFLVLPLLLVGLVFERVFTTLQGLLEPLLSVLPGTVFRRPSVRLLVVGAAVAVLLLLVGWLTHTRIGRAAGRWLESAVLDRVPLYPLMRSLVSGLAGQQDETALRPALITVDAPGLQQLGLIVERHPDGSATVFLPSSPNPSSGTVVVVEPSRIRELDVSTRAVFGCMARWGDGAAAILKGASDAQAGKNHAREEAR